MLLLLAIGIPMYRAKKATGEQPTIAIATQSDIDGLGQELVHVGDKLWATLNTPGVTLTAISTVADNQAKQALVIKGKLDGRFTEHGSTVLPPELVAKAQALQKADVNLIALCDNLKKVVTNHKSDSASESEITATGMAIGDQLQDALSEQAKASFDPMRFRLASKLAGIVAKSQPKAAPVQITTRTQHDVVVVHDGPSVPAGEYRYAWNGQSVVAPVSYYDSLREVVRQYAALRSDSSLSRVALAMRHGAVPADSQIVIEQAISARQAVMQRLYGIELPGSLAFYKQGILDTLSNAISALDSLKYGSYSSFKAKNNQNDQSMRWLMREFSVRRGGGYK